MLYTLTHKSPFRHAQIEIWDEIVVAATPSFQAMIGRNLQGVIFRLEESGWSWKITDGRMPSLAGKPSDSELASRLVPKES